MIAGKFMPGGSGDRPDYSRRPPTSGNICHCSSSQTKSTPRLRDLPADARLVDVFKKYPGLFAPLIEFHQRLLREKSPFTVAERELLAAYVSMLNACGYCAGVHEATARLAANPATAPVPEPMRPVFRHVKKLTETPARMTDADAAEIFAAGWDDRALRDAVAVCALFNCMNRLVEGYGISAPPEYFQV